MCGLVGVITKARNGYNHKQIEVFETLLWLDTLRGEDSTGIFAIDNIGNVGIAKQIGTGEAFLGTETWNKKFRPALIQHGWGLFGHNRKATRGTIIDENAHPFWVDDKLVLIHNGSFNGCHRALADTAVDSHAIAHVLAEHGSDDIEGALKKVNAAYALIWYDTEKKRVNMIRNDQRPLSWVETADAWYFASEKEMLEFALGRHNVVIPDKNGVYSFPEYSLNQWSLQEDKSTEVQSTVLDCKYKHSYTGGSYSGGMTNNMGSYYRAMGGDSCGMEPWEELGSREDPVGAKVVPNVVELFPAPQEHTTMPWMAKMLFSKFASLRDVYTNGKSISVIVDDYLDVDVKSSTVKVTGVTLDDARIPTMFDISRDLLETLTNPHLTTGEDLIFEITVSNCVWKKTDTKKHRDIDMAEGVMFIDGKNPVIKFKGQQGMAH